MTIISPSQIRPPVAPASFPMPITTGAVAAGGAVTPSDTVSYPVATQRLWIGTGGTLTVMMAGQTVGPLTVVAGWFDICCQGIMATGTTATGIIAFAG